MPRPDRNDRSVRAILRHERGTDTEVSLPNVSPSGQAYGPSTITFQGATYAMSGDVDRGMYCYDQVVEAHVVEPDDSAAPEGGWCDPTRPPAPTVPDYAAGHAEQ